MNIYIVNVDKNYGEQIRLIVTDRSYVEVVKDLRKKYENDNYTFDVDHLLLDREEDYILCYRDFEG